MSLRESACLERYGSTFDGPEIAEQIDFSRLPLSSVVRPLWDARTLESLGFCEVEVDGDITGVLWDDKEKLGSII